MFALSGSSRHRRALSRERRAGGRRCRGYRADAIELCASRPHGGFHGASPHEIYEMMDKKDLHDEADEIRAETAAGRAGAGRARPRGRAREAARGSQCQGALCRCRDAECPAAAGGGEAAGVGLCRNRFRPRHAEPCATISTARWAMCRKRRGQTRRSRASSTASKRRLRELDAVFARNGIDPGRSDRPAARPAQAPGDDRNRHRTRPSRARSSRKCSRAIC